MSCSSKASETFTSACRLYTGGAYSPDVKHPRWQALIWKLESSEYSAYEFVYAVIFLLQFEHMRETGPAILRMRNFVTSDRMWDAFWELKQTAAKDVGTLCRLQRDMFHAYANTYGQKERVLHTRDMAAPVRVDLALFLQSASGDAFQEVMDAYLEEAAYICRGVPEYLQHCVHLNAYLKEHAVC